MTVELYVLSATALLAACLWMPFIVGVTTEDEDFTDFTRPPELTRMRPWVHRAFRAHQNLIETLMPFAIMVLIAHVANISKSVTVGASIAFLVLRIIHAFGMISGLAVFPIRPVVFVASWACTMTIAGVVFLA